MILTLIGLIFSFIGSVSLVFDTLYSLGKPKPTYFPENKKFGWKAEKLEPQKDGFCKRVKHTKEEIKLAISLSLLSLGFLLQILDFKIFL
ncbi:MAG: hypothetical protein PHH54_06595 [Candidatus Nanoarchaeia archaeon]|nr:hypothetical protein [Candidatus Nanoarchaeia archaeon]MDD5741625.1 hypothetical protein [Candidatus Nanoarchaeia archaeon]